jgi:hypothetical protein
MLIAPELHFLPSDPRDEPVPQSNILAVAWWPLSVSTRAGNRVI